MAKEAKKMTEAQKQKMAEGRKKAAEKKAETKETKAKTPDDRDQKIAFLEQQIEQLKKASVQPQVIQVSASTEKVHFLWMAEVADDNIIEFGPGGLYGRIVGKTGSFHVPKDDLSRILDGLNRYFIHQRWLVAVSGLTDEERAAYGMDYREGETLDRKAFGKLVDMGEEILEIYPELCEGHKQMVAKRYYEAWGQRNPKVTYKVVSALNAMSPGDGRENGAFAQILKEMHAEEISGK